MQAVIGVVIFGLLGGIAVGLQSTLASMIGQRIGSMESTFIVHFGGAVAACLFLLPRTGGKLAEWRSVPWYALAAGALGLVVIGAANYAIPRVGVVTTIFLIVAGQLMMGTIIDHFGLFETSVRHLDPTRILGMVIMLIGVWLIVR